MSIWLLLTDRQGNKSSVNFNNVDYFLANGDETEIYINNMKFPIYVTESEPEVRELLNQAINIE